MATSDLPIFRFAEHYRLDSGQPIKLETWQVELLRRVFEPGQNGKRQIKEALVSTAKKSGKTELLSLVQAYMLLADSMVTGQWPAVVINAANDLEQARHAFLRAKRALEVSPTFRREVTIPQGQVTVREIWRRDGRGYYKAVAADVRSAGGERPTMTAVDEIGYYRDWALINEYQPGPEHEEGLTWYTGFRGPMMYNVKGCPLHDLLVRGEAGDPELHVYDVQANPSSWVSEAFLARKRRQLPDCEFRRVWLNEWAAAEDSFLTEAQIRAAVCGDLAYGQRPQLNCFYLGGLDIGLRHDRTVFAVVECNVQSGRVRLVQMVVWQGSRGAEVNIGEVEAYVTREWRRYGLHVLRFDFWQAAGMAQRLATAGCPVEEYPFNQASLDRLARGLYGYFADGLIDIPEDSELIHELAGLVVKQTLAGIRWDHLPGQHDDRVTSLGLALSPLFEDVEPEGELTIDHGRRFFGDLVGDRGGYEDDVAI